jgi:hypothetical protein
MLLATGPVTAAAQDKPDFSGRWVLVSASRTGPDVATSLIVRQPVRRTNAFGAPMPPAFLDLVVERQSADRVRTDTFQIGVSGGIVGGGGVQSRFSVRWEGNRLVISNENVSSEHTEEWELSQGSLVITTTDRDAGGDTKASTLIYRKSTG